MAQTVAHAGAVPAPLDAARALVPLAAELAPLSERDRTLRPALVEALVASGLVRLCIPRSAGGLEADPATVVRVIEEVASGDGAAGWCLMIAATTGALAAYLPAAAARQVFGDPGTVTGGVFAPRGRAVAEGGGGYMVTGRWPFASGVGHCTWLVGGCAVEDPLGPRLTATGALDPHLAFVPASQVTVHDTWSVSGLRGTGSHDMEIRGARVPAELMFSLVTGIPLEPGPLYAVPPFGLLAAGVAAVALGIARGAVADLVTLAAEKVPGGSSRRLAERGAVQADVARAEASIRAARSFLLETLDAAYAAAAAGEGMTVERRIALRLAATHATTASAQAVDLMYTAAGGSAIYESSPLQRRFRDVHTATQHMIVAPATSELAGRLLLGLPTDLSLL